MMLTDALSTRFPSKESCVDTRYVRFDFLKFHTFFLSSLSRCQYRHYSLQDEPSHATLCFHFPPFHFHWLGHHHPNKNKNKNPSHHLATGTARCMYVCLKRAELSCCVFGLIGAFLKSLLFFLPSSIQCCRRDCVCLCDRRFCSERFV